MHQYLSNTIPCLIHLYMIYWLHLSDLSFVKMTTFVMVEIDTIFSLLLFSQTQFDSKYLLLCPVWQLFPDVPIMLTGQKDCRYILFHLIYPPFSLFMEFISSPYLLYLLYHSRCPFFSTATI